MKRKQMVSLPLCWLHVCLCIAWKQTEYFSYLKIYCSMVISKQHWNTSRQFFLFKNCRLLAFFVTWLMTAIRGFAAAWLVTRSREYVGFAYKDSVCISRYIYLYLTYLFVCLFKDNSHLWPLTLANPCSRLWKW